MSAAKSLFTGKITCFFLAVFLGGCAESLYYSSPSSAPLEDHVLIGPYFAEVSPHITVSIAAGANAPPTMTITYVNVPRRRSFLFLKRNAFYSDVINISTDGNGMLMTSETASTQQVNSIISSVLQTALAIHNPLFTPYLEAPPADKSKQQACWDAVAALLVGGPSIKTFDVRGSGRYPLNSSGSIYLRIKIPDVIEGTPAQVGEGHPGIIAFFPVPAIAYLGCKSGSEYILSVPQNINMYIDSQYIDPQRDFLWSPQDNYTFSAGILTGHKFVSTSPAKTLAETVTLPVRSAFPSTQVTTNTSVISSPGKPDQSTTNTTTTTGPTKPPP